jgi:membrane-bound lytic murein transglycosylase A
MTFMGIRFGDQSLIKARCLIGLGLLVSLTGCSFLFVPPRSQAPASFYRADFNPQDPADDLADTVALQQALDNSLRYYASRNPEEAVQIGQRYPCTMRDLKESLQMLKEKLAHTGLGPEFFDFIKQNYDAYVPTPPNVLVTAYCTPQLNGSYTPTTRYAYPLYRLPDDLVTVDMKRFETSRDRSGPRVLIGRLDPDKRLVPYFTRDEIDYEGVLKNKRCELLWVDSPADLYFLQIEGSGLIQFESGASTPVAYAGMNGRPCRMIGKLLREENKLPAGQMSIPGIKRYLKDNPCEVRRVLSSDPSYVFFEKPGKNGVEGCYGMSLAPFRSFAADRHFFPPGILGYLELTIPVFNEAMKPVGEKKIRTLVFNQDTGGVIRGPARVDWYTGSGPLAEALAGYLNTRGRLCLLVKKKISGG